MPLEALMSETSERELFPSPSPLDPPPQIQDLSLNEVCSPPNNDNPVEDVETHKYPSIPPNPSYSRSPISVQKKIQGMWSSQHRKALLIVLVILLLPTIIVVFETINVVILYKQMQDVTSHLQAAAIVFHSGSNSDITKYFDTH